jgi:UDP-N-acetylmuramate dehydrogenase
MLSQQQTNLAAAWVCQLQAKAASFAGTFQFGVRLAKFNTWGVGGGVACVYAPTSIMALADFLAWLPDHVEVMALGLGSNVLFADGWFDAVFIHTPRGLRGLAHENACFSVEAGVTCAKFARFAMQHGVLGAGFFAGIPGTMGGALAMNAGAFGGETWPWVKTVDVVTRRGHYERRLSGGYCYGYRVVSGPDDAFFVAATLMAPSGPTKAVANIDACLLRRKQTQPIGTANCGSVFRNPVGYHAAALIEACGLKGHRFGYAQVSPKHANFIINLERKACAADISTLMRLIQKTVYQDCGVWLFPEVKMIGFVDHADYLKPASLDH